MKISILAVVVATLMWYTVSYAAADAPNGTNGVLAELKAIISKVQDKALEKKITEADLAPELKEFDDLLAKHKDEKTDDVARVLLMKAILYQQVFKNEAKAGELMEQLKKEFPDSTPVVMLKRQEEAVKLRAGLKEGTAFPDFDEKDLSGEPLSIARYKGKVVLVDFWATWCGPCIYELPNVLRAYEKHHPNGFEIIGISLDQEREKLDTFIRQRKLPWPQYFDGEGWGNKLAQKYGVNSIPATYLLDREGRIIAKDLRGEDLEKAVAKALAAQ